MKPAAKRGNFAGPGRAEYDPSQDRLVETAPVGGRLAKPKMVDSRSRIVWEYVIPVATLHLLVPLAFLSYFFSWWGVLFLPVGGYLFGGLGIGGGYHRLLTHRGFSGPKWLEYTLITLGVCSIQGAPAHWVLVHRVHHQHSDHQPDPHTPKVGFFWSHVGWMFVDNRELNDAAAYARYVRDVLKDPYCFWLQRGLNAVLVFGLHAILIVAIGAMVGLFWTGTGAGALQMAARFGMWGVLVRTVYGWHVTWSINSFSHIWGYRNYATREDSRNNWLFALLSYGEGWHNNHHADPRSARHGHRWWEIDVVFISLITLEKLGLIQNLVRPKNPSPVQKL